MFRAVLPDGRIRDLNTQFGQFGLDTLAAPGGIGFPHLLGQCDELAIQGGSSHASSGFPAPEQAKAQAMPSDDGLRLEEQQDLLPVRPEAPQTHPEQSVGGVEFGFTWLAFEHGELMSERQVFKQQLGMALEAGE